MNIRNLSKEDFGKRVFVYYNLHKHVWSIKDLKTNLVIGHCNKVILKDVTYKVYESGRQKVLATKQKNVHAGCVGELIDIETMDEYRRVEITYNPYKYDSFVEIETKEKVYDDDLIIMENKRVYALR